MNLNGIHDYSKDLLRKSQEYFGRYARWEKTQREKFIEDTTGGDEDGDEDDEED